MKSYFSIFSLVFAALLSCKKGDSTSTTPTSDLGSWSYNGRSFKSTYTAWTTGTNAFQGLADSSAFQVYFTSSNPESGVYPVYPFGDLSHMKPNQLAVAIVDQSLPGITYLSTDRSKITAEVTKTGSSYKVKVSGLKLYSVNVSTSALDSLTLAGEIKN